MTNERERLAEVEEHIREAEHELDDLEHPYGSDKFPAFYETEVTRDDVEQQEIKEQAAIAPDDPQTKREELELDLMEEGESELGEEISSADSRERRD